MTISYDPRAMAAKRRAMFEASRPQFARPRASKPTLSDRHFWAIVVGVVSFILFAGAVT